jgi:hypothetical protein
MIVSHHPRHNAGLKIIQNTQLTKQQSTQSLPSPQFGYGLQRGDGKVILGFLAVCAGVIGLGGIGIGYLATGGGEKREPATIQTPVKTTADEVKDLQQQLDAKKAKLEQERLDLEAKLKAVQEAEQQLKQ